MTFQTRREALAAGLTVACWGLRCRRCGSQEKKVSNAACIGCATHAAQVRKARDKAIRNTTRAAVMKGARAAVLREMAAAEKQRQRDAERATAKAIQEAAKAAQKKAETIAKSKATRAVNKTAKSAATETPAFDWATAGPPWDTAELIPPSAAINTAAQPSHVDHWEGEEDFIGRPPCET